MSQIENTITWEKAQQIDSLKELGEHYEQLLHEAIRFFTKNTIFQLTYSDAHFRTFDLLPSYSKKDYSEFLFTETQKVLDEVQLAKGEEGNKIKEIFTVAINRLRERGEL
ncbi:hypothetical protein Molly5_132 [Maribacter phage Molly_5]|uniref:Uncharacterized protein n=1 Tax=Maribacter phage Molly_1 TaxID=2745685 RepID=A0A8E4UY68_9CAUD|nr:hypothetical protein M1M29_gp131 [Maribacter phage Molly_1]QQO97624.1 hypothetical protein Molly2_131 [Maribacter phage Molly_2]QQO97824.1 hypothetical protein Molly3_131 [Maribacter phage Molly_3]QQO98025.1 hypothetical protein Molly4_132 [Maribacter phage Molly_4]QQO98225.1 hypothetical protein Molly5_132 [Maribacter phage Molly_5]QQO97424.1 hypothetical protein Molly1_131 [Maribacter phage Molly_1]